MHSDVKSRRSREGHREEERELERAEPLQKRKNGANDCCKDAGSDPAYPRR